MNVFESAVYTSLEYILMFIFTPYKHKHNISKWLIFVNSMTDSYIILRIFLFICYFMYIIVYIQIGRDLT